MDMKATTTSGIGWNGKSVKEMLQESEQLFKSTGHYYGVERLDMKSRDPIGYEKLSSRLRGALVGARETARSISGNPIVRETGELCFALYTPEGDSIALSTGIMAHVHTMSEAIKYMIRNDYEDMGIEDGDIFINNDPIAGDVHPLDVQNFVPIFHGEELIGWAAGVTHCLEVGVPAGDSTHVAISRFQDGWILTCQKNGTRDQLSKDYVLRAQTATRMPFHWKLDEKARISGCHAVRSAIRRIISEIGIDTYKQFMREVIEDTRRTFIGNIKLLTVPGTYRYASFAAYPHTVNAAVLPVHAAVDSMVHAPMSIKIGTGGTFDVDLDGSSKWGHHTYNATPTALQAGLWVCLTEMLIHNDKINDGAYLATTLNLPYGSWANPDTPYASTQLSWMSFLSAFTALARALGQAFASRGYVEEVMSGYNYPANITSGNGPSQYGDAEWGYVNFEFSAAGLSARYTGDGVDTGGAIWNPEGDMGDVEAWEQIEPLLYLGRRIWPNSAGMGKYRGGSGFETIRMVSGVTHQYLRNWGAGKVFFGGTLFGGYPAPTTFSHMSLGTGLKERFAKGLPYPVENADPENNSFDKLTSGTSYRAPEMLRRSRRLEEYDLYWGGIIGGNGLGDVLEREPQAVVDDISGGHLLERFAEPVFGVVCKRDGERLVCDMAATEKNRSKKRTDRLAKSTSVDDWKASQRQRLLDGKMSETIKRMYAESLVLSDDWAREFRRFWDLPADWVPTYDQRAAS